MAYSLGSGKNIKTDSSGRITSVDVGGKQTGFNEAQKQAFQAAVAGGDPTGGGFRYRESPFDRPGSYQDAAQNFGITPETPYGTARPSSMVGGFFNKLANATGGQVNYNLTPRQIQQIMERSYSRAINPYNIVGQPGYYSDAGGDLSKGIGRVGLKQGEMTREGIAQAYRAPISGADRAAIGLGSLFIPGSSIAADQGTRVMGLGDRVPEGATPLRGGILDAVTGGQTDFLQDKFLKVNHDLHPVQQQAVWDGVIQADSQWAYADQGSYKMALRMMFKKYDDFIQQALELQDHVNTNFGDEALFQKFCDTILDEGDSNDSTIVL